MQPHSPPTPTAAALAAHRALCDHISSQIHAAGGTVSFADFMAMALYTPNLGYYSGGSHKIGAAGDFITAPVLTPLFAQTLAVQLAQLLPQTDGNIYEFGAGTGALAADLLNALGDQIKKYHIIELSSDLRQRQHTHLQQHAAAHCDKVQHLTALPEQFDGIIIGNEVLDAMPVERVRRLENGQFAQIMIGEHNGAFYETERPLPSQLQHAAATYFPDCAPYTSELHPAQHAFICTLASKLKRGAMLWIDYGFDAAQYYHSQRNNGTLIGHYRHHVVHDPFYYVGLTDLTAHVNFTDLAQAACDSGLDLIGYTTQATFLLNLGITDQLATSHPDTETPDYARAAAAVNMLTAPHEMGELFKVMALGKDIDPDWQGFAYGDICHKL